MDVKIDVIENVETIGLAPESFVDAGHPHTFTGGETVQDNPADGEVIAAD